MSLPLSIFCDLEGPEPLLVPSLFPPTWPANSLPLITGLSGLFLGRFAQGPDQSLQFGARRLWVW